MRSKKPRAVFERVIDISIGLGILAFTVYLYKCLFVQEYTFIRNFKWVEAIAFGFLVMGMVSSLEKYADVLRYIMSETTYYRGPERIHFSTLSAFLVTDMILSIIALSKPQIALYRLHGPSIAAGILFLLSLILEMPTFYDSDGVELFHSVLEGGLFLLVLKSHYHWPIKSIWMKNAFVAFLFCEAVFAMIIRVQRWNRKRRKERYADKTTSGSAKEYQNSSQTSAESARDSAWESWRAEEVEQEQCEQQEEAKSEQQENLFFFEGCRDLEELRRLYLHYCKVFHPDNPETGNEDLFKKMKEQYEMMKKVKQYL